MKRGNFVRVGKHEQSPLILHSWVVPNLHSTQSAIAASHPIIGVAHRKFKQESQVAGKVDDDQPQLYNFVCSGDNQHMKMRTTRGEKLTVVAATGILERIIIPLHGNGRFCSNRLLTEEKSTVRVVLGLILRYCLSRNVGVVLSRISLAIVAAVLIVTAILIVVLLRTA